jgi:hypothetical protein
MNRGSFRGRGKTSDRLWSTPSFLFSWYRFVLSSEVRWSPLSSADFKNEWCFTFNPKYAYSACTGTVMLLLDRFFLSFLLILTSLFVHLFQTCNRRKIPCRSIYKFTRTFLRGCEVVSGRKERK